MKKKKKQLQTAECLKSIGPLTCSACTPPPVAPWPWKGHSGFGKWMNGYCPTLVRTRQVNLGWFWFVFKQFKYLKSLLLVSKICTFLVSFMLYSYITEREWAKCHVAEKSTQLFNSYQLLKLLLICNDPKGNVFITAAPLRQKEIKY